MAPLLLQEIGIKGDELLKLHILDTEVIHQVGEHALIPGGTVLAFLQCHRSVSEKEIYVQRPIRWCSTLPTCS